MKYNVTAPDGKQYLVEGPEGASDEVIASQVQNYLTGQANEAKKKVQEHASKTGFISNLLGSGQQAFGSAEQWMGEQFNAPSITKAGEENIAAGAARAEQTTPEDVEAAKARGFLPGLAAQAERHVLEPLGGVAGRFGAQVGAGALATGLLPEELGGAAVLGTALKLKNLVAPAATFASDFPVEAGENIQEQKTVHPGEKVDLTKADLTAIPQALIASVGIPGTGAINKLIGPKVALQAEKLAPLVKSGELTEEQAVKQLSNKYAEYGRAVVANAVTGTGLMVGTSALRKAQAGEDTLSPEAISEYIDMGATGLTLAPIFGGMHMMFSGERAKAHETLAKAAGDLNKQQLDTLLAAIQNEPNRSIQDILNDIHRNTISELPLKETEKDRAKRVKEAQEAFEAAWNEPSGKFTSDPETGHERELTAGEVLQREHPELYAQHVEPLEQHLPQKGQLEMFGPNGEPIKYVPGEEPQVKEPVKRGAEPQATEEPAPQQGELFPLPNILTKEQLMKATGIGRTAKILGQLEGLDINHPEDLAKIKSILTEYADHPDRSKALSDRIGAYLESLPKIEGEENGVRTTTANGEGTGADIQSSGGPGDGTTSTESSESEQSGNAGAASNVPPPPPGETGLNFTLATEKAKRALAAEPHEDTWAAMSDVPWESLPKELQDQVKAAHEEGYLNADTVDDIERAARTHEIEAKRKEADISKIRDAWLLLRDSGAVGVPHWDDLPEMFKKDIISKAEKGEDGKYTIPVDTTMDIMERQIKHTSTWVHDAWNALGIEPWDNLPQHIKSKIADVKKKYGELTKSNIKEVLKELDKSYKNRENRLAEQKQKYEDWMNRPYEAPYDDRIVLEVRNLNPMQEYTKGARTVAEALKLLKEYIKQPGWLEHKEASVRELNRQRLNELIDKLIAVPSLSRAQYHVSKNVLRSPNGGTPRGTYFGNEHAIVTYPDSTLKTILHESVHAATVEALDKHIDNYRFSHNTWRSLPPQGITPLGKNLVKIWRASKKAAKAKGEYHYGNQDIHEFIAEAFSNKDFMAHLIDTPSVIKSEGARLWDNFKNTVRKLLRVPEAPKSLFDDVMNHSSEIFEGYTFEHFIKDKTQALSRLDNKILDETKKDPELERLLKASGYKPIPEQDSPSLLAKIKEPGSFVKTIQAANDKISTWIFSSDAAFQNGMRRAIEQNPALKKSLAKAMLDIDTGQAANNQSLANYYIQFGGLKWNPELHKFEGSEQSNNFKLIFDKLNSIAKKYNISLDDAQIYGSRFHEASRLEGVDAHNQRILTKYEAMIEQAKTLKANGKNLEARQLKERANNFKYGNYKIVHMTAEERAAAMKLADKIPELKEIANVWNKEREKVLQFMVDNGTISKDQAQEFLNVMDYVPFHRVEQIEAGAGLKEYTRGLVDASISKKFVGSTEKRVNNIYDNMQRWINYEIKKAVNNKFATNMVDWAGQVMPDVLYKVEGPDKYNRANTFSIWRNGYKEYYETTDPMFMHAFKGVQSVSLPALKGFSKFTNLLRNSIVLNPVFSLSQLPQDAFTAMVSSGVKHPFMVPVEAFKEFVTTLTGTSKTHEALRKYGITGHIENIGGYGKSDNPELARALMPLTFKDRALKPLRKLSMAADNAVRQAIYNRVLKEGGSEADAVHAAQEIINFRRAGSAQATTFLRQTIPFFGAYLQSMNVIAKTLSGHGLNHTTRSEGLRKLVNTSAQLLTASLLYNMLVSDDEGYKNLDPSQKDRRLIMPGTNGAGIPLRMDFFTVMYKVIPEHMYQMNLEQGAEDSTKAKKAIKDALIQAVASPNMTPQFIKPAMEAYINYDYFTGRPIVGQGLEVRDTELQYTPNTSELAKVLGSTGLISPMKVDHLVKGYFGYSGGLALLASNSLLAQARGEVTPSKSVQDMISSVPGMTNFVPKEFGARDVDDFYELRTLTDKAVNSFNALKKAGEYDKAQEYRDQHADLIFASHRVNRINDIIAKLRQQERRIYEDSDMTPQEKEESLRDLKIRQKDLLEDIKTIRKEAGL